jgi:hypothetical protein
MGRGADQNRPSIERAALLATSANSLPKKSTPVAEAFATGIAPFPHPTKSLSTMNGARISGTARTPMPTWDHPQLGRFTFEQWLGWQGEVDIPAFAAFTYEDRDATGKYQLSFEAADPSDVPTDLAIELVSRILANQAALVERIKTALWNDFLGVGPRSGMWWSGDLDQVADRMFGNVALTGPEVLFSILGAYGIMIRKGVHGYERAIAEIDFRARFEEEHGLGVLTDGDSVLGLGYAVDVLPFGVAF